MKLLVTLLFCIWFDCAAAASYIKFDGIDGEATTTDGQHDKWIPILSMDWGAHVLIKTKKKRTSARPQVDTLKFACRYDQASPYLQLASVQGKIFEEVVLDSTVDGMDRTGSGPTELVYLKYKLTNVRVVGFDVHLLEEREEDIPANDVFDRRRLEDALVSNRLKGSLVGWPLFIVEISFSEFGILYTELLSRDEHEIEYDIVAGV